MIVCKERHQRNERIGRVRNEKHFKATIREDGGRHHSTIFEKGAYRLEWGRGITWYSIANAVNLLFSTISFNSSAQLP
jgi:hypothetical protein